MSGPAARGAPPGAREILLVGLLALLLATAALVAFFGVGVASGSRLFFTNEVFGSDFWHLNYPFRRFYADGLAEGRLPLWCPDIGLGYPLLADGQLGALHPLNLLLYSLLPLPVALNWEILLHLALAGAFAAMYARQVGAGRSGCALAAITYGLCGFFLAHLKHANMLVAGAWFPAILLLMERYASSRRAGTLALLAVTIGVSAVGGHPQLVYYNLLMAGLYGLWLLLRAGRRPREEGGGARGAGRLGAGLLLGAALGLLLGAPQILPSLELKRLGPREAGLTAGEATRWDLELEDLAGFVYPSLYGDPGELEAVPALDPETGERLTDPRTGEPLMRLVGFDAGADRFLLFWEMTAYVGLLPLLLALLGVVLTKPRAHAVVLLLLLVLALVLSLGRGAGLFFLFRRVVPGFDLFRFPSRFLLYADFAIAVLAALGLTAALRRLSGRLPRLATGALTPAVLVVAGLDIWIALGDHNPEVEAERWLRPPPIARRILAEEGADGTPFRIATMDPGRWVFTNAYYRARGWKGDLSPYVPAWNTLDPNLSLLFGIDNAYTFSPVVVQWATEATQQLFLPPEYEDGPTGGLEPKFAALLNVRYLIDPFGVLGGRLEPLAEVPGGILLRGSLLAEAGPPYTIRLYRNPVELPRAFLVPRARFVPDDVARPGTPSSALAAMVGRGFDPRVEVVIAGSRPPDDRGPWADAAPIDRPVEVLEHSPHRVRLRADAPNDCWLFLSDLYYPGWVAEVDGAAVPVRRANIAGRAVRVPAGRHEIVFEYRPASFAWGVGACALALVSLLVLLVVRRRMDRAAGRR